MRFIRCVQDVIRDGNANASVHQLVCVSDILCLYGPIQDWLLGKMGQRLGETVSKYMKITNQE